MAKSGAGEPDRRDRRAGCRAARDAILLDAVRARSHDDAVAAAKALATFRDDATVLSAVRAAREADPRTRKDIDALLAR